ncbi:MAG: hypothetical protein LBD24_09025 [Spirochaetaceae bacterium]|nr:hypothetical protein [Spirochaetaceae bacterium]
MHRLFLVKHNSIKFYLSLFFYIFPATPHSCLRQLRGASQDAYGTAGGCRQRRRHRSFLFTRQSGRRLLRGAAWYAAARCSERVAGRF